MNWYYAQGDQRQGPFSETEFDALIASGKITETTLVWKEGMADWVPLKAAPARGTGEGAPPGGWIRCTATGLSFPPEEIVYLDGKPYSAAAKPAVLQGVMQSGALPHAEGERNGPAWEHRQQLGFLPAIWQTIRAVLTEPNATFSTMKREGGLGTPLGYLVPVYWFSGLFSIVYSYFQLRSGELFAPKGPLPLPVEALGYIMIGSAVLMPAFLVLGAFIGTGMLHLSLMICQGAKQPFEATFRTYCYVRGSVAPFLLIPFCGGYIAGIWMIVGMCIGLARVHEINTGRAVLAVFLPMIACFGLALVFGFMFAFFMASQGAHH